MINLRNLAKQQKNQQALKYENIILKQTQNIKLEGSLSSITKKLDEVKETTQQLGDVFKESQPETPQLAFENALKHQPKDNIEAVIYDVELENTSKNMTGITGFFKTYYDREHGWM